MAGVCGEPHPGPLADEDVDRFADGQTHRGRVGHDRGREEVGQRRQPQAGGDRDAEQEKESAAARGSDGQRPRRVEEARRVRQAGDEHEAEEEEEEIPLRRQRGECLARAEDAGQEHGHGAQRRCDCLVEPARACDDRGHGKQEDATATTSR